MADTVHALILMQMESQASEGETHQHPHKQHQSLQRDVHRCFSPVAAVIIQNNLLPSCFCLHYREKRQIRSYFS